MSQVWDSFISISSPFLWIFLVVLVISVLTIKEIRNSVTMNNADPISKASVLILTIVECIFFVFATRSQPGFVLGTWKIEFCSIFLFYSSIFGLIFSFVKNWNNFAYLNAGLAFSLVFQLSFVIAYGSPAAGILLIASFISWLVKFFIAKDANDFDKMKLE